MGPIVSEIDQLMAAVRQFSRDRDWEKYHTPKDLAIGIATEAAELLALHRFQDDEVVPFDAWEEIADVLIFALRYADVAGISIYGAIKLKLLMNAERYPVTEETEYGEEVER